MTTITSSGIALQFKVRAFMCLVCKDHAISQEEGVEQILNHDKQHPCPLTFNKYMHISVGQTRSITEIFVLFQVHKISDTTDAIRCI